MEGIMKKLNDGQFLLEVSKKIYNADAVLKSTYKFTNKCYMHIDSVSEERISICFKAKANDINLEALIDDFCNELIDQQVRFNIEKGYGSIRDMIVKKAFIPIDNPSL